ncbi:SPOR domain-containing protein [Pedobacter sandarakinus]|uniref:SPOR domain-containing protein n=1 Tax=Pedobacter sandarakinus TaxID=353156 RepID=UPI0022470B45|nr:SPOR domain-containing protein [Pedobacter sandarakinus]MCX2574598.1 SPOR domain-containing protein [Pedobacter sandarakinus]
MDILLYLFELLQQQKEVGLVGLGTFYKKKYPGKYDKEQQMFLPPGFTLQFKADVSEDKALAEYIVQKRNISTDSANYYISQFVEKINAQLAQDHESVLENIGRLFFTEHEGLSFEPATRINYGSEFFGLPALNDIGVEEAADRNDETPTYDEIGEAPIHPINIESKTTDEASAFPVIENVSLDEVEDDLKHTMQHLQDQDEQSEAPAFIKAQHEEHPNRFGHTPENELDGVQPAVHEQNDAPDFIKEQHAEHPNRFGHTPEDEVAVKAISDAQHLEAQVEQPKTYLHLEDDKEQVKPIVQAPGFIQEQHAEHPNRFGHDPTLDEPENDQPKSVWPKILLAFLVILLIAVGIYFFSPNLFSPEEGIKNSPQVISTPIDSAKLPVDSAKAKQDSIAKTDSILKANQITTAVNDTSKAEAAKVKNANAIGKPMYHVIAVSYETEAAALRYIQKVKKIGLNATIAKMEGKRKKVSIASYATKAEAEKQKDILQKRLRGEGFYVKEIKNNTQQ